MHIIYKAVQINLIFYQFYMRIAEVESEFSYAFSNGSVIQLIENY